MLQYKDQRVGVFIDVQNMYYSARNLFQRKVSFANIVAEGVGDRKLIRAIAYVVTTKGGEESPFLEALEQKGIELKKKELLEYFSGQKKADWDVGITVDVIKMLDMLDVVVLVSGDGDFIPLVHYIQSRGRQVIVISFRESTSSKLVEATDLYINMSENKRKFLIGGPTNKGRDARNEEDPEIVGTFEPAVEEPEEKIEDRRGRRMSF
ncbi:MAG: NYN domain-containing protein [Patescibacteria group bacterium]